MVLSDEEYRARRRERTLELNAICQINDKGGYCCLCGEPVYRPWRMEDHHIAGRRNSDATIPVCYPCHRLLSEKQRYWPEGWSRPHNSPKVRIALIRRSLKEIIWQAEMEIRLIEWEAGMHHG